MLARAVLLVIPSIAMAVVGVAMFGPGAARPFASVELWGGPTTGVDRISVRVLALERMRGIDSASDVGDVLVRFSSAGRAAGEGRCTTDANGSCDILVDLPPDRDRGARLQAVIYALPGGRELASGELSEALRWGGDGAHAARLSGSRAGPVALEVASRRGVFVAPFRDELTVRAIVPLPYRFTARATGADLDSDEVAITAPDGALVLERQARPDVVLGVTPRTHAVDLELEAGHEGAALRWASTLPVVPGAMWLDPAALPDGSLHIVSAVPRSIAYASVAGDEQRLWGGAVRLAPDAQGFEGGTITLPEWVREAQAPLWLTLSSDPRGTGSGTVGWALWPERTPEDQRERAFRDRCLLDGMPLAELRDQQRRGRARRLAWIALVAAACVEAAMLAQLAGRPGSRRSWLRLAIALATVVLAFSAVGLVVMWKTSS